MSVYHRRPQIVTVMTTTITADSLLPRPKLDCDVGYDAAVKGTCIVVNVVIISYTPIPNNKEAKLLSTYFLVRPFFFMFVSN